MSRAVATKLARRPEVLTRAVVRAADRMALAQKTLAAALGVSEATISRLSRGRTVDPSTKEGELAILVVRLFRSLDALVGGNSEQLREWMHARNVHLAGTPAELIRKVSGLVHVVEYLDALRGKS